MRLLFVVALLTACSGKDTGPGDVDGDGVAANVDCDDNDPTVHGPTSWYLDADADGWGDSAKLERACKAPAGYVAQTGDCDDNNPGRHPGAPEVCNNIDDNCDGRADEGVVVPTFHVDADGDGFGDAHLTIQQCTQDAGLVLNATDCDDGNPDVHPAAPEVCNGLDDNCDGRIDNDPTDGTIFYADIDADGFGNPDASILACQAPSEYVADGTDCNDHDASAYPGGTEVCDGVDNNCDGNVDESATDAKTWYADADHDGYGDAATTAVACEAPTGFVSNKDDCDDTNKALNPSAVWYADADGDTYGDPKTSKVSCLQPKKYVTNLRDCDDTSSAVHPGATEVCDGIDNDCDGVADGSNAVDAFTWYQDLDNDGYGTDAITGRSCVGPSGFTKIIGDCDDGNYAVHPNAPEVCDGYDNDCNGYTDDADPNVTGRPTWYADYDFDGYGEDGVTIQQCNQPFEYTYQGGDCDDGNYFVNPGAAEVCNGIDDNCNGLVDQNDPTNSGLATWYRDADNDKYGDKTNTKQQCNQPLGYVSDNTDCDDKNATVNPGQPEICNDHLDNNCDGSPDACVLVSSRSASEADVTISGTSGDEFGLAITPLGDIDGDGKGDLTVAAPLANGSGSQQGAVFVFKGAAPMSTTLAESDATAVITGAADFDQLGGTQGAPQAIARAGDIEGDGKILLAAASLTAPAAAYNGQVYLLDPTASGTSASAVATITGGAANDFFGLAIAGAGDVDGDGNDDLLVGSEVNTVYLFHGPTVGAVDTTTAFATMSGEAAGDGAGTALDGGDDVDGDGNPDQVIGAPYANADAGAVYLVTAAPSGASSLSAAHAIFTGDAGSELGSSVAMAGDVDGDGYGDLVVGAPLYNISGSGAMYVFFGGTTLTGTTAADTSATFVFQGDAGNSFLEMSVGGGGDVDGDGLADVVLGAPQATSGSLSLAGIVYLQTGLYDGVGGTYQLSKYAAEYLGQSAGGQLGVGATSRGDYNGDGFADLLFGGPSASGTPTAYVFDGIGL